MLGSCRWTVDWDAYDHAAGAAPHHAAEYKKGKSPPPRSRHTGPDVATDGPAKGSSVPTAYGPVDTGAGATPRLTRTDWHSPLTGPAPFHAPYPPMSPVGATTTVSPPQAAATCATTSAGRASKG